MKNPCLGDTCLGDTIFLQVKLVCDDCNDASAVVEAESAVEQESLHAHMSSGNPLDALLC
jgi:hypothetical protein